MKMSPTTLLTIVCLAFIVLTIVEAGMARNDLAILGKFWIGWVVVGATLAFVMTLGGVWIRYQIDRLRTNRTVRNPSEIVSILAENQRGDVPPPHLWIGYQPAYDEEAKSFAHSISGVLRASGWDAVVQDTTTGLDPFEGIQLILYGGGPTDPSMAPLHEGRAKALIDAFNKMEEVCVIVRNQSKSDSTAGSLVVGPRSSSFPVKRECKMKSQYE